MAKPTVPTLPAHMTPPQFQEFMEQFFGDKRGVLWPVGNIQEQAIDLTNQRVFEEQQFQGDFMYADSDSTGTLYIKFNNPSQPWMPFRTNMGIYGFPIQKVFLKNAAQAGKSVNLKFGYGARIIPPNQDITTIGSITNTVNVASVASRLFKFADDELDNSRAFWGQGIKGAIAAQTSIVTCTCIGGNIVIDRISVSANAASLILIGFGATTPTIVQNVSGKNINTGLPNAHQITADSNAVAPLTNVTAAYAVAVDGLNNQDVVFDPPLEVSSGNALVVCPSAVNIGVRASFQGRTKI